MTIKDLVRLVGGRLLGGLLRVKSEAYRPSPANVLVIAPHADDETLGCGGLLALKSELGQPAHVVFVSDSAGLEGGDAAVRQAGRRRDEALTALAVLGVPREHIHFMGLPDGRLNRLSPGESDEATRALARLLVELQPAEIFVPYRGGGSTEHDAVNALVATVIPTLAARPFVWEYPVWAWWDFRRLLGQVGRPAENFRLPLGRHRARKQRALASHVSQANAPGAGAPPLPAVLGALCTGSVEYYFNRQPLTPHARKNP